MNYRLRARCSSNVENQGVYDVHANQITQWKQQLAANAATAFGERESGQREGEIERLHAKIGGYCQVAEGALTLLG
jgi:hypothetical protein